MKYLKKFENFDLGRFNTEEGSDEQDWIEDVEDVEDEEDETYFDEDEVEDDEESQDEESEMRRRVWGDEVVEKKKMNPGFKAYLDKQKAKKEGKKDEKESDKKDEKESKKDTKKDEKEVKGSKGLTAKQKKLPAGLQKAILAKKKK